MKRKQKQFRPRNSLRHQIHAETDPAAQLQLAAIGHQVSPLESCARTFLALPQAMKDRNAPPEFRAEIFDHVRARLLAELCLVLVNRDGQSLRELASFLDKKGPTQAADPLRARILEAKALWSRPHPTYDELAACLSYTGPMEVFRRTVKECDFPIRKQLGGRPSENPLRIRKK